MVEDPEVQNVAPSDALENGRAQGGPRTRGAGNTRRNNQAVTEGEPGRPVAIVNEPPPEETLASFIREAELKLGRFREAATRLAERGKNLDAARARIKKDELGGRIAHLITALDEKPATTTVETLIQNLEELSYDVAEIACAMPATSSGSSEERQPKPPFKVTLPRFNGRADEFASWRKDVESTFEKLKVQDRELMFMSMKDADLLPGDLRRLVRTARSWTEYWDKLSRKFTHRQVRDSVMLNLTEAKVVSSPGNRAELEELKEALDVFAVRIEDHGETRELDAWDHHHRPVEARENPQRTILRVGVSPS